MAKEGPWQTAQVSPLERRMNPSSPQAGPQLFLMVQAVSLEPTMKTAWLMFLAQLLKTPLLQGDQLEASTRTAMGLRVMICSISSQPCPSATPNGLNEPVGVLQDPSLAVQGYSAEVVCPLSLMYSRARTPQPPLHPWFSQGEPVEQSTSCCSLRSMVLGWLLNWTWQLSWAAVAPKAQHDPHWPWFFTFVTTPLVRQSTASVKPIFTGSFNSRTSTASSPRQSLTNSSLVRSENWFSPIFQVWEGSALCLAMVMRKSAQILLLYCSWSPLGTALPCRERQARYWEASGAAEGDSRLQSTAAEASRTATSRQVLFIVIGILMDSSKIRQQRHSPPTTIINIIMGTSLSSQVTFPILLGRFGAQPFPWLLMGLQLPLIIEGVSMRTVQV